MIFLSLLDYLCVFALSISSFCCHSLLSFSLIYCSVHFSFPFIPFKYCPFLSLQLLLFLTLLFPFLSLSYSPVQFSFPFLPLSYFSLLSLLFSSPPCSSFTPRPHLFPPYYSFLVFVLLFTLVLPNYSAIVYYSITTPLLIAKYSLTTPLLILC